MKENEGDGLADKAKKKLVIVNNSGWWYRARVNAYFQSVFNETNSYSFLKGFVTKKTPRQRNIEYLKEIANTKFVICPPGIFDEGGVDLLIFNYIN